MISESAMKQRTVAHSSFRALELVFNRGPSSHSRYQSDVLSSHDPSHQGALLQIYLQPQLFHPVFDDKYLHERKKEKWCSFIKQRQSFVDNSANFRFAVEYRLC